MTFDYLTVVLLINFFWDQLDGLLDNLPLYCVAVLLIIYGISHKGIKISKNLLVVILVIIGHGIINIYFGNDNLQNILIQALAIFVSVALYSNVVSGLDMDAIMKRYYKTAVIMSYVCIIQEIMGLLGLGNLSVPIIGILTRNYTNIGLLVKVVGTFREPSFVGYFLAPAIYLSLVYIFEKDSKKDYVDVRSVVCVLLATMFTFSLVAYTAVIAAMVIIWLRKKPSVGKIIFPLIIVAILIVMYVRVPDIRIRVDDTLEVFTDGNLNDESVNLSSFTYYNAFRVVLYSIKKTYGLGAGIDSTAMMYSQFGLSGYGMSSVLLNSDDANSMLFRILIEFGIIGLVVTVWFLIKYSVVKISNVYSNYTMALWTLFIILLLRQGNYMHGGILLFVCLYVKNYKESKLYQKFLD